MSNAPVVSVTDELIAELEAIREDASDLTPDSDAQEYLGNLASRLLAEREELKRDADRYRWLRDDRGYFPEEEGLRGGSDLDAAIDTAMQS